MPGFKVNQLAPSRRLGVVHLWLCLLAPSLGSCKTTQPKDEVVVVAVDTAPVSETERTAEARPAAVAAPTPLVSPSASILSETLQPVRGGERALPPYRGPQPCKMALAGSSPVARSCSEGGMREAVDMMQLFVKRARKEGMVFVCLDCHPDEDDFSKLAPDADSRFRELLFLARPSD